jgi:Ca-activated chloride channel family protein
MNDKQPPRNLNDDADQTVEILDSVRTPITDDEHQTLALGHLIRESVTSDLPERNPALKELMLEHLENDSVAKPISSLKKTDQANKRRNGFLAVLGIAASLMLLTGVWWSIRPESQPLELANGTWSRYQLANQESADELIASNGYRPEQNLPPVADEQTIEPPVVRYETRTRTVPVTKTRSETRTRQVPVTKYKSETIVKTMEDGTKIEEEVSVPYTEMTTQNYTVQVPYTENVTQSRMHRVEVGKDGEELSIEVPYSNPSPGPTTGKSLAADRISRSLQPAQSGLKLKSSKQSLVQQDYRKKLRFLEANGSKKNNELHYGIQPRFEGEGRPAEFLSGGEIPIVIRNNDFGFNQPSRLQRPNTEQYTPIHENHFTKAIGSEAVSTFSVDVDTAAYANMRRFLTRGQLPPRDSVRIEELVNYFSYNDPQPTGEDPFSVNMELADCPWNTNHKLLRVGLKGKEVHIDERPATNVVFLIDVSGSMNNEDKLPLLKRGFEMMVNQLNENDRVSIVTYAGSAGVVLEPTNGAEKKTILSAINGLTPGGSTHGSAGIQLAYELAQKNYIQDGVNKVILATDGDLNVGITKNDELVSLIKEKASENVFLTVLGFGTGNLKDDKMEQLADNGNGNYAYIDGIREARKVLVEELSASLVTIAKDVKLQIEFNPAEVISYRLIGYENRMLETKDFNDDRKDAGEIGAGHSVTALYELVTTDKPDTMTSLKATPKTTLKYQGGSDDDLKEENAASQSNDDDQSNVRLSSASKTGELLTLALRYKEPEASKSKRIEFTIKNEDNRFDAASEDFRFSASVASFGMLLRGSKYQGETDPSLVQDWATGAIGKDRSGYRAEFLDLVRRLGDIAK